MVVFGIVIEVEVVISILLVLWFITRIHLVLSLVAWSIIFILDVLHHQVRFLERVSIQIVFQIHDFLCQLFKSIII